MAEYEGIYEHFAQLLASGQSAMDGAPFHLVADAMMVGQPRRTPLPGDPRRAPVIRLLF